MEMICIIYDCNTIATECPREGYYSNLTGWEPDKRTEDCNCDHDWDSDLWQTPPSKIGPITTYERL